MFNLLTDKLTHAFKKLRGQSRLSESNVQQALKEVRQALLEADTALPVIQDFLADVKEKALGNEVDKKLNPSQAMLKIVNASLKEILGHDRQTLNYKAQPPIVILLTGLQGSGKTTTAGKLAHIIKTEDKKSVMLASCDIYRPAAIEQLAVLANQIEVPFFETPSQNPLAIAKEALEHAKRQFIDVLIVDTAGRLHVDEAMMSEIKSLHVTLNPTETLFIVDGMTGQDAVNTAKAFHDAIPLTGIIPTKMDGDTRGGAILSVKKITGVPIKYIGIGEKIDGIEPFHPERIASRILGMGDVLTLIEEVEKKTDSKKTKALADNLKKGKTFTLNDFREQLLQMQNMGNLSSLIKKLPGVNQISPQMLNQVGDKSLKHTLALINSMTPFERQRPHLIIGSRKRRIANGAGLKIQDVNKLLSQFEKMQKMMKKFAQPGGIQKMMRGLGGLTGMGDFFGK